VGASATTAEAGGRRWAGRLAGALLLLVLAGAVAGWGAVLAGYRPLVVRSGSMSPTIQTGDLVLSRLVHPGDIAVDDVVTFRDQSRSNELVTHRVLSVRREGRRYAFVTRGDANTGVERWAIDDRGTVGLVAVTVPKAGYVLTWLGTRPVRVTLIVVAALVLAAASLRRIWFA
jgi:signal peptidase I